MKACKGNRGLSPLTINLGARWRSLVYNTPQAIYPPPPWERTLYPLCKRFDGSQSQSGKYGEEKNTLPLPGFEPQPVQLVA